MPELPEVETITVGLNKKISGKIIKSMFIRERKIVGYPENITKIKEEIQGKRINVVYRRGKYILIKLSGDKTLVIHLRMTGKLFIKKRKEKPKKHTHIIFHLNDELDLRFNNMRKFGRIYFINKGDYHFAGGLADLGPEPISDDFTSAGFKNMLSCRNAQIKSLLINQKFLAGLGNIYTDEALFEAGILPNRKASELTEEEVEKLYQAIKKVLTEGIKYGGTSFSDYVNALGKKGAFQRQLQVYQCEGDECFRCGEIIIKKKIAGRGTRFCPSCQR